MRIRTVHRPLTLLAALICPTSGVADDADSPGLLPPQTAGGKPLMEALQARHSTREFDTKALPPQTLSNLLWAAHGVNRPDGKRTAPSAKDLREIDILACTADGVFLHDPGANTLQRLTPDDIRAKLCGQPFAGKAPVVLLTVADLSRMEKIREEDRERYAWFDAGCICQNIYLFCASEGLATVVHELDREKVARLLKLKPEQRIVMAQSVAKRGPSRFSHFGCRAWVSAKKVEKGRKCPCPAGSGVFDHSLLKDHSAPHHPAIRPALEVGDWQDDGEQDGGMQNGEKLPHRSMWNGPNGGLSSAAARCLPRLPPAPRAVTRAPEMTMVSRLSSDAFLRIITLHGFHIFSQRGSHAKYRYEHGHTAGIDPRPKSGAINQNACPLGTNTRNCCRKSLGTLIWTTTLARNDSSSEDTHA